MLAAAGKLLEDICGDKGKIVLDILSQLWKMFPPIIAITKLIALIPKSIAGTISIPTLITGLIGVVITIIGAIV